MSDRQEYLQSLILSYLRSGDDPREHVSTYLLTHGYDSFMKRVFGSEPIPVPGSRKRNTEEGVHSSSPESLPSLFY